MPFKVLIVEDEPMLRSTLRGHLEDYGYDVVEAGSGEDGVEVVSAEKPDFAIVDMRLPRMDGNDFVMAAHERNPNMRFLIHTGSVGYSLPNGLRQMGLTREHVFKKPLEDLDILVEALRRYEKERA